MNTGQRLSTWHMNAHMHTRIARLSTRCSFHSSATSLGLRGPLGFDWCTQWAQSKATSTGMAVFCRFAGLLITRSQATLRTKSHELKLRMFAFKSNSAGVISMHSVWAFAILLTHMCCPIRNRFDIIINYPITITVMMVSSTMSVFADT